ncbi:hypothetical protein FNV43_RR07555 [Rhamnella rubrinervis]|uniref:LisH domain-containing protein n=1 Tax=Rhamnella rubrinervis TaxID=2594499 RepID=A0A8K0MN38_9ROSA|nr:hypothetical protein FNV43_RR07555 [Rhamnella rubrinervis]
MAPPVDFWDPQQMLELYLHDYMVKRKMYATAEIFKKEAKIPDRHAVINSPEGFLYEWWSVLHDVCASRQPKHQEEREEAFLNKTMQMKENEQRDKHPMVPHLATLSQQIRTGKSPRDSNFGKLMEQEAANELATKIYDEGYIRQSASEFDPRLHSLDVNKLSLSKSAATSSSNPFQGMYKMVEQQDMKDKRTVINSEQAVPTDPYYVLQNSIFPITGSHDSGMYEGLNPVALNGWPLNNNQLFLQKSTEHQQPLLSQVLSSAPGKQTYVPGSCANFVRSNVMPPKSESRGMFRQMTRMMENSKQTAENQLQHEQLQHQKLVKNGRKRKAASHTGANSLDCTKAKEAVPVAQNVESFLCHDDDNAKNTKTSFSDLKCPPARSQNEHKASKEKDWSKRKPVLLELYIHNALQTIEDHLNKKDMKFMIQLPCCSCFCFIKGKKSKGMEKDPDKEKDPNKEKDPKPE